MPELAGEIKKLEVRLEAFLKAEEEFVRGIQNCLEQFQVLNSKLEKLKGRLDSKKFEELMDLRLEAARTFHQALKRGSGAEHEKSHLLESYGTIVLATEEAFQKVISSFIKKP